MPKQLKLYYFDAMGRAEPIRQILYMSGVDFEDIRYGFDEWCETYKKQMPFGLCPVLELPDGTKLAQSYAILKYLGQKYDLHGETLLDDARADMIGYTIDEFRQPFRAVALETDEVKQAELRKVYEETTIPEYLGKFEMLLKQNKDGDGYLVGDKISWIDVTLVAYLDPRPYLNRCGVSSFDLKPFPKLRGLIRRVEHQPKIAEWLCNRPPNDF